MKTYRLFLFAIALMMLSLFLAACELPFDIPFLNGGATTKEVTTEPVTTSGVIATLPTVTAAPNPITEVKEVNMKNATGLRLTFRDKKAIVLEAKLAPAEGRNGVSYTYTFDKESGILSLTLYDAVGENIALSHLGELPPPPLTVRIRESNKSLEWAYADSEEWAVLCKTGDTTAKPLALLCKATGFAATELPTGEGVTFVISGNDLRFRAHNWQNEGYDFCNDAHLHSSSTDNFLLNRLAEISSMLPDNAMDEGTLFKEAGDEIPATNINGTYIAGCHGYFCISSVPNGGFTEDDIGLVFTRKGDGQQYVLVKVPGTAWFCPFDEAAMESGNFAQYGFPAKGLLKENDVLTYEADGKEKSFTVSENATQTQLRFPSNHRVQHAYLNGTVEVDVTKDGVYNAEFVDFYERYDILYLPAVLEYLMNHVGDNTNASHYDESFEDSYFTYFQTHRFHNNGSYTVYQTISFNTDVSSVHHYGVMSCAFSGTEQWVYAPGSENCGTPTNDPKDDNQSVYATGDYTIRSFYHFPDPEYSKGMNVGYYPYFGVATDEIRATMVERFGSVGEWYSSMKMYPHLFKADSVSAGESISYIGYHTPTVRFDDDFFAINWYFVDDEIYLSMHTTEAVAEKTVAIPNADYLVGLSISIEEASEGFTVVSDTVTADGITVSTTGAGYVILKLTAN